MAKHLGVGKLGEDIACEYLVKSGYRILGRNYRQKWGEIDIIARARDLTLVFVEVKTLNAVKEAGLTPEDNLTPAKLRKLRRTCEIFANSKIGSELVDEKKGWRIDLLTVFSPQNSDLTNNAKDCVIHHYQNI
jgi:putative endonuclease